MVRLWGDRLCDTVAGRVRGGAGDIGVTPGRVRGGVLVALLAAG